MKKLFIILLLCGCAGSSGQNKERYTESNDYNFAIHNGKTIRSMTYNEIYHGSYCHTVRIEFTDGSVVEIAAYKYRQHIY